MSNKDGQPATPNQMVERESFLGEMRKLRQAQELLSQPLHPVRSEAAEANEGAPIQSDLNFTEYLKPVVIGRTGGFRRDSVANSSDFVTENSSRSKANPESLELPTGPSPKISDELREKLLGKSPLRLVVSREPQFIPSATQPKYWIETLECSHQATVYPDWYWDDGAHLVLLTPSSKRRRCQECKAIALQAKFLPPKKPAVSANPAKKDEDVA